MNNDKVLYLMPKEIKEKTEGNKNSKKDWATIYWYNNRKKTEVCQDIKDYKDYDKRFIEKGERFNKKTLYKDISLSNKSKYFDYYKILKKDIGVGTYYERKIDEGIDDDKKKQPLIINKSKLTVKF